MKRTKQTVIIAVVSILSSIIISCKDNQEVQPGNVVARVGNEIITQLLNGGLWPLVKQRPFNKIARLGIVPRDIFVNGMNTSPLAADPELLMQGMEEFFKTGLQLLSKLTDGKIHLVLEILYIHRLFQLLYLNMHFGGMHQHFLQIQMPNIYVSFH